MKINGIIYTQSSRVTDGKSRETYVELENYKPTVWAVLRRTKLPFCFL